MLLSFKLGNLEAFLLENILLKIVKKSYPLTKMPIFGKKIAIFDNFFFDEKMFEHALK